VKPFYCTTTRASGFFGNQQIQQLSVQVATWQQAHPGVGATPDIQKQIDQLNQLQSANQLDMLKLQSMVEKQNQAFDMMSNWLKHTNAVQNKIIGNMR
jgi:hypothetical protein